MPKLGIFMYLGFTIWEKRKQTEASPELKRERPRPEWANFFLQRVRVHILGSVDLIVPRASPQPSLGCNSALDCHGHHPITGVQLWPSMTLFMDSWNLNFILKEILFFWFFLNLSKNVKNYSQWAGFGLRAAVRGPPSLDFLFFFI